jgi:thioredoxin reductase
MRVAVIGAGAAGLVTARELARAGHQPVVFEKSHSVGGVWVYSPSTEADPLGLHSPRIHSSLYASLRTNLPRDLMAFIDYPFDARGGGRDDWPRFPGHACVLAYLQNFARDHGVLDMIRFGTEVRAAVAAANGWNVRTHDGMNEQQAQFDAVAVCNGHYADPRVPELPGLQHFPARLMHSHNYREPQPFTGERVALFGASASALDLSNELATTARELYCCGDAFAQLPASARDAGGIRRLPGIRALNADGSLDLNDDTRIEPVDTLIFCTGYHYRFPFLSPTLIGVEDNWVQPLYQDLLHIAHPTLAFIGIPFRVVPFPLFEVQARWFARHLAGQFALPAIETMQAELTARTAALRAAGVKQRHFHQRTLDCFEYLDALCDQSGSPRLPDGFRQLTAALLAHVATHAGAYRDRPMPEIPL